MEPSSSKAMFVTLFTKGRGYSDMSMFEATSGSGQISLQIIYVLC